MPAERPGARLGVDVGTVRIGVAVSDPDGRVAVPMTTVRRGPGDVEALAALGEERGVASYIVGLPRTLSGSEGPAAAASRRFAGDLARRVAPLPVVLVDERLTTAAATQALRGAGLSTRQSRPVVDQVAAAALLQGALDTARDTGRVAGEVVVVAESGPSRGEEDR